MLKPTTRAVFFLATASIAAITLGCKVNPTDPSLANSSAGRTCPGLEAMIADCDDNNNQTNVAGGRGGYWYTFADTAGTEVWPTSGALGGTFEMSPGGAENTPYGARFKGTVGVGSGPMQAGMGLNFLDPKGAYDASAYGGIAFWAKKGPGSVGKMRVKIPDETTDPDAGICSECYNDYGMDITVTENWQRFILPFSKLKQLEGWGKPRGFSVSRDAIFGIQFQVDQQGQAFDIWVDQIQFTGCPE
ncbi:MAG: hypothetical protein MK135_09660 [Polyangiaceae bacterium]|nr:hypothetical protein [Polyangiaceae bacterium]